MTDAESDDERTNAGFDFLDEEVKTSGPITGSSDRVDFPKDIHGKFHRNTVLALDRAAEILSKQPDPRDKNYAAELRAQAALINTQVAAQTRVDEQVVQAKRDDDLLANLLEELRSHQATAAGRIRTIDADTK